MAITFVGVGTIASANALAGTTGQLADVPTGVLDDDFLIIISHRNDNIGTFDALTGWTRQDAISNVEAGGEDRTSQIYTRVASSEPADYTVTHSDTANEQWSTLMLAYRGVHTTTPLDVTPTSSHYIARTNKASPNVDAFQAITTITDNAWVIALECVTHDDITSSADPSGYTSRVQHTGGAIDHRQIMVWDKEVSPEGPETPGAPAYTSNQTAAESNQATMALRPAPITITMTGDSGLLTAAGGVDTNLTASEGAGATGDDLGMIYRGGRRWV